MTTPTFRIANKASQASGTSITVTRSGYQTGDILIGVVLCHGNAGNPTLAAPSGWTQIDQAGPRNSRQMMVVRRIATSTSGDDLVVTGLGASDDTLAVVVAYANPDSSDPIGQFDFDTDDSSEGDPPTITTDEHNSVVLVIHHGSLNSSIPSPPNSTSRELVTLVGSQNYVRISDDPMATAGQTRDHDVDYSTSKTWLAGHLQLNAANVAPNAPTLGTPAAGATHNLPAGFLFDWEFSDPDVGDSQSAYAFRRRVGAGAYEYWNAGTVAWQAGEVYNTSLVEAVTFPAAKWTTATTYEWSVRTKDAAGVAGPYASNRLVTALAPPVLAATDPTSPVTTTSRPLVEWTLDQSPQQALEVKIESGAYGATPGSGTLAVHSGEISSSVLSWLPTIDLDNGTTYRAFVRAKAFDQWSDWDTIDFTMTIPAPSAPTLVADWEAQDNRVALTVTGTHVQATYPDTLFRIEYSDDGSTWLPLRGAQSLPGDGTPTPAPQTAYDYEAPPYATRQYRAFTSREV